MHLPRLIEDDLFERVLIEPSTKRKCNELLIITGYASSAVLSRNTERLGRDVSIRLLVGMTQSDGVRRSDHERFRSIQGPRQLGGRIECRYELEMDTHSKVYVWLKDGVPTEAWIGSANYSFRGFGLALQSSREVLAPTCPATAYKYAEAIFSRGIDCASNAVNRSVKITDAERDSSYLMENRLHPGDGSNTAELSILSREGTVHGPGGGLNWGLRGSRNPNEAYIPVPAQSECRRYLPPKGTHFTVWTDDGEYMTLARGGDNGKNLTTPQNNSILGRYLRRRLGVQPGEQVRDEHVRAYGRSTLSFHQLRDDLYRMDFSRLDGYV